MKRIFYYTILFCGTLPVYGQLPLQRTIDLNAQTGGVRAHISAIDCEGRLWLGTNLGLFVYNGYSIEKCEVTDTFDGGAITALYEDDTHQLWIGYKSGLIRFLKDGELRTWIIDEGLPRKPVTEFMKDANGLFWFSTYGEGLYCYRNNRLYNFNKDDGLSSNEIYCMDQCSKGFMWIGTDGGIDLCSWIGDKKSVENHSREDGIPDEIVLSIEKGKDEDVWIGTYDRGFGRYDAINRRYLPATLNWQYGTINNLTYRDSLSLFIGTEDQGVFKYDHTRGILQQLLTNAGTKKTSDLTIDLQGNLWVTSNQPSIKVIHDRLEYYPFPKNQIQALTHDGNGSIWIGTSEGLFEKKTSRYDPIAKKEFTRTQLNILSLDIDDAGMLWIGTFGQGLFRYNPETNASDKFSEESGLLNNNILSVKCDKNKIWIASLGGASVIEFPNGINREKNNIKKRINGLDPNYIYSVFIDSQERVWFGLDGKGISYLSDNHIRNFDRTASGLSLKSIYGIAEDNQGRLWIINNDGKVFYFTDDEFQIIDHLQGSLDLSSIECSSSGEIVISHQNGIILINPESLKIAYLAEEYGLSQLRPNINVMERGSDGHLWIGAMEKLIRFKPDLDPWYYNPQITLEGMALFDEPVNNRQKLTFKPKENYLSFNYLGLSYFNAPKVTYRYQLVGHDPEWKHTKDQSISYSQLSPGKFTFNVQASYTDRFENLPVSTISLEIRKALWDRWWFWILLGLFGSLLVYTYIKRREKRLQIEADRKRKQIEFQYNQLQSQVNPHFLFNSYNTLLNILDEKPDIAASYVEKLSDFYRQVLFLREKELVSLNEEIRLVRNYHFLLSERYGDFIKLIIKVESYAKYLAPLSLQMLVENAVKHNKISKKHPLTIEIYEKENRIIVKNPLQPKLQTTRSTSFGLKNIVERYTLLIDKPVEINNTRKEFIVSLPLITNKLSYESTDR